MIEEVPNHLEPLLIEESHASDVRTNDQAR